MVGRDPEETAAPAGARRQWRADRALRPKLRSPGQTRHFATESSKSKGQFYTQAEVTRILAKVVGIGPSTRQDQTV